MSTNDNSVMLDVQGLKKYFPIMGGILRRPIGFVYAVDDVSFSLKRGETLGLVGESGCGKTTVARCVSRLIEPTDGRVYFKGRNILEFDDRELRKLRTSMQIVFQDPYASLNPRMTVKQAVGEPLIINRLAKRHEIRERVLELLRKVGLTKDHLNRFPHEFSGGQRQRICIARALASNPEFIVLDEPSSSLDVSVQSQILNLLKGLQREMGLTYLFISHNLSVIKHMSDRIAVMYLGKIVEIAQKRDTFENRLHPYTEALFSAIPIPNPDAKRKKIILPGDVPSPANPPSGCRFHTRCPYAQKICSEKEPALENMGNGHFAACFFPLKSSSFN
ncbi:MAG: ABC transporter ATP-binding protein [Candidatus Bathyarchaeia archaeon]